MEVLKFIGNVFLAILLLFSFIPIISIINRLTKFLLSYKLNKTIVVLLHMAAISFCYIPIHEIYTRLIPDSLVYLITAIFIGPIIGASSNIIVPYIKDLKFL